MLPIFLSITLVQTSATFRDTLNLNEFSLTGQAVTTRLFDYADYHRTVIGYHGTTREAAERLVDGEPFRASHCENKWFGQGIYFWEWAPKQAWNWAKKIRAFPTPGVIGAAIRLGNCFDLLEPMNIKTLKEFKESAVALWQKTGVEVPENHRRYKNLDCAVFNLLYQHAEVAATPIDTARAV
jgi:hypothetical protein